MVACLNISLGKSSSSLLNKEMMKTSQRVIMDQAHNKMASGEEATPKISPQRITFK
jgi:hypothetical protein